MIKKNDFCDLLSSHLSQDARAEGKPVYQEVIFVNAAYELSIMIFPGLTNQKSPLHQDLITFIAVFKEENDLRIMAKLVSINTHGKYRDYVRGTLLPKLEADGKTPLELILSAKKWTNTPLTQKDRATFLSAGLDA